MIQRLTHRTMESCLHPNPGSAAYLLCDLEQVTQPLCTPVSSSETYSKLLCKWNKIRSISPEYFSVSAPQKCSINGRYLGGISPLLTSFPLCLTPVGAQRDTWVNFGHTTGHTAGIESIVEFLNSLKENLNYLFCSRHGKYSNQENRQKFPFLWSLEQNGRKTKPKHNAHGNATLCLKVTSAEGQHRRG